MLEDTRFTLPAITQTTYTEQMATLLLAEDKLQTLEDAGIDVSDVMKIVRADLNSFRTAYSNLSDRLVLSNIIDIEAYNTAVNALKALFHMEGIEE